MRRRTLLIPMLSVLTVAGALAPPQPGGAQTSARTTVLVPEAEEVLRAIPLPATALRADGTGPVLSRRPTIASSPDPSGLALAKARARWAPDAPRAVNIDAGPDVDTRKLSVTTSFNGHDATTFTRGDVDGDTWSVNRPDLAVAASETTVLQTSLYGLMLSNRSGGNVRNTSIFDLFGIGLLSSGGEPSFEGYRVEFDPLSDRFFMAFTNNNYDTDEGTIYVLVSRSASPAGFGAADWCTYAIDPKVKNAYLFGLGMGFDPESLVVTGTAWEWGDHDFVNEYFWVIDKETLVDNAASCPAIDSSRFKADDDDQGFVAFAVQPASNVDGSGPGGLFMLSTQWRSDTMSEYIVHRVVRTKSGRGPKATITSMRLTGDDFQHPPDTAHKGGGELNTGQATITQAAFREGRLYGVHSLSCKQGPAPNESCLRVVEILVDDDVRATGLVRQSSFGVGKNKSAFRGAVAVNADGHVGIAFHYAGSKRFLAAAYTDKKAGAGKLSKVAFLKKGNYGAQCGTSRNQVTPRAGIQVDPADGTSFVMVGEYGNKATPQPANNDCRWAARVGTLR